MIDDRPLLSSCIGDAVRATEPVLRVVEYLVVAARQRGLNGIDAICRVAAIERHLMFRAGYVHVDRIRGIAVGVIVVSVEREISTRIPCWGREVVVGQDRGGVFPRDAQHLAAV